MKTITLDSPKEIKAAVIVSTLTIDRIVDLPNARIVRAFVKELPNPLVLWEKDAYDQIGNWTDVDAETRIKELLSN
jgi:hypothetical protein